MRELEFRVGQNRFATLSIPNAVSPAVEMEMIAETVNAALVFSRREYGGNAPIEIREIPCRFNG